MFLLNMEEKDNIRTAICEEGRGLDERRTAFGIKYFITY